MPFCGIGHLNVVGDRLSLEMGCCWVGDGMSLEMGGGLGLVGGLLFGDYSTLTRVSLFCQIHQIHIEDSVQSLNSQFLQRVSSRLMLCN